MLTDDQLHAIMPDVSAVRRGALLPFLQAALAEFGIDPPARSAAFLAQVAHESGQFRFMEEIWGPTPAQRRYEPVSTLATTLGNTEPGDGKRFKGRGPIQITGRANYRRFGGLLGIDLESEPARAALPQLAFRIAGLFWMKNGLNELADLASADAFRRITRRINGGFNGLADRERFYALARVALGVPAPRVGRGRAAPAGPEAPVSERGAEALRGAASPRRASRAASAKAPVKPKPASRSKRKAPARPTSRTTQRKTAAAKRPKSGAKATSRAASRSRIAAPPIAKAKRASGAKPAGRRRSGR
jgi:putative chitinase